MEKRRYKKRITQSVVAVQLDLKTEGFSYTKWGAEQRCKKGDWLLNNQGDIYTVDQTTFEATYKQLSPGIYIKSASVWAVSADEAGRITTKEGETHYRAGDYLVYNDEAGSDGYAVSRDKFEAMYEPE